MATRALGPGIYRDGDGFRAIVSVGPRGARHQRTKRFAGGTPLRVIIAWQEAKRAALRAGLPARQPSNTLTADIERYIRAKRALASWRERRRTPWAPRRSGPTSLQARS